jgi:hypothetical protein
MRRARFSTGPSPPATDHLRMDVVAILLGVLMFAVLLGLVYGIERI